MRSRPSAEQILPENLAVASSMQTWMRACLFACLLVLPTVAMSADRRSPKSSPDVVNAETVEMFAAMKAGDIDVSFIPKDSSEARVVIKNKTDKPLNLKLPEAFAGVPVLAQGRGGAVAGRPGGAPQAMGGGMGGMGGGMGMGGMGGGMGMMNIPAEKVAQFKVATVCLEHGKREPRSSVHYEIKPIDSFTTKPEIKELLTVFGKQHLNQRCHAGRGLAPGQRIDLGSIG